MVEKTEKSLAIIYKVVEIFETLVFIPSHVAIGEYLEDEDMFYDYLSERFICSIEEVSCDGGDICFEEFDDIKDLKNYYQIDELDEIAKKYYLDNSSIVKVLNMKASTDDEPVFEEITYDQFLNLINGGVMDKLKTNEIKGVNECAQEKNTTNTKTEDTPKKESDSKQDSTNIKLEKISVIYENLKKDILSQDEQIKRILTAIYKSVMFGMKSNILVHGPSGVGKTQIFRSLSKIFNVPILREDMTKYTEVGYYGQDVEEILYNLYENAEGNLELAQKSILVLDEIDKKASTDKENAISKTDVLNSLLSIIDGDKFIIAPNNRKTITFDTSKLIVIACGAFTDLREEKNNNVIGFEAIKNIDPNDITISDFMKYGMTLEFMGRFKTLIKMNSLSKEDLKNILKYSNLSPLAEYKKLLEKLGKTIEFSESTYEKIADKAYSYKTGARALKMVVEELFEDVLFDWFDSEDANYDANVSIDVCDDEFKFTMRKNKGNKKGIKINA